MAIVNKITCRAIIIKGNQILLAERKKNNRLYYTFPGVDYIQGQEEDCISGFITQNLKIGIKVVKKIYEYFGNDNTGVYFLINWTSGLLPKNTEIVSDASKAFTPVLANISKLEEMNIVPPEIKEQFIADYNKYGKNLGSDILTVYEE